VGIYVSIDLGSGANLRGTAGAWAAANNTGATGAVSLLATNGATFDFTGDQLEPGTIATTFEQSPFGDMLRLCQREFSKSFALGTAPVQSLGTTTGEYTFPATQAGATTNRMGTIYLPVTMRATPTVTTFNPAAANAFVRDEDGAVDCTATSTSASDSSIQMGCTGHAAVTVGRKLGVHWTADARL
jgi:hypothetical protein